MAVYLKRRKEHSLLYHSEKELSQHILNRKANAKLNYVVKSFESVLGERHIGSINGFLDKKLMLQGLRFLNELRLKYKIENRFFAMSFDLHYEAKVQLVGEHIREADNCAFLVKLKGALSTTGAEFADRESECGEDNIKGYLDCLNNKLIIDRIVALDLTNIQATYRANTATWTVSCRSLIGSTTWNLIPPVMHLITPKQEEFIKLIEFFELVFDAVVKKKL